MLHAPSISSRSSCSRPLFAIDLAEQPPANHGSSYTPHTGTPTRATRTRTPARLRRRIEISDAAFILVGTVGSFKQTAHTGDPGPTSPSTPSLAGLGWLFLSSSICGCCRRSLTRCPSLALVICYRGERAALHSTFLVLDHCHPPSSALF